MTELQRPRIELGNLAFYRSLGYEVVQAEPHPHGGHEVAWIGKRL
jgi:hypothetical protein